MAKHAKREGKGKKRVKKQPRRKADTVIDWDHIDPADLSSDSDSEVSGPPVEKKRKKTGRESDVQEERQTAPAKKREYRVKFVAVRTWWTVARSEHVCGIHLLSSAICFILLCTRARKPRLEAAGGGRRGRVMLSCKLGVHVRLSVSMVAIHVVCCMSILRRVAECHDGNVTKGDVTTGLCEDDRTRHTPRLLTF